MGAGASNTYKAFLHGLGISYVIAGEDKLDHGLLLMKLKDRNKELLIVPGANYTDLYDNMSVIPFDKIELFFKKFFMQKG